MIILGLSCPLRQTLFVKRIHLIQLLRLNRNSSNLPQKIDQDVKPAVYNFPIIPRDPVPHNQLKLISQEYHGVEPIQFKEDTNWYPIFRFPYIITCRVIIRFKVLLTSLSLALSANSLYLFILDPKLGLFASTLASGVTLGSLVMIGNLFRTIVVQIYTTDDVKFVRICRFTFFGNRLDMILPTDSIVPISDNNTTFRNSFINLETKKPDKLMEGDNEEFYDLKFRLSLFYGGITDNERFEKAMGRLVSRKINFLS